MTKIKVHNLQRYYYDLNLAPQLEEYGVKTLRRGSELSPRQIPLYTYNSISSQIYP
jgi:hypothetical protein